MITRVRIEAHGETHNGVQDQLTTAMLTLKHDNNFKGVWEEEESEIVPAKEGFWGRLTWRRTDHG